MIMTGTGLTPQIQQVVYQYLDQLLMKRSILEEKAEAYDGILAPLVAAVFVLGEDQGAVEKILSLLIQKVPDFT